MNERILNMILDEIERLKSLDRLNTNDTTEIKALYEDVKLIKGPGFNFLQNQVEQLLVKSGAMRAYVQYFQKGHEKEEKEYVTLVKEWMKKNETRKLKTVEEEA